MVPYHDFHVPLSSYPVHIMSIFAGEPQETCSRPRQGGSTGTGSQRSPIVRFCSRSPTGPVLNALWEDLSSGIWQDKSSVGSQGMDAAM